MRRTESGPMASVLSSERYREFVVALRSARLESRMTQTELAKRLGRPQSYVSKVERLERRLDPAEFYDWATALGADAQRLFAQVAGQLYSNDSVSKPGS